MTRYVIDARTLVHVVDEDLAAAGRPVVRCREAEYLAVTRLQADALVTVDPAMAMLSRDLVPLADVGALTRA